jgi:hypothetical protein
MEQYDANKMLCFLTLGGISEKFSLLNPAVARLYEILLKAHLRGSLMGCSIYGKSSDQYLGKNRTKNYIEVPKILFITTLSNSKKEISRRIKVSSKFEFTNSIFFCCCCWNQISLRFCLICIILMKN